MSRIIHSGYAMARWTNVSIGATSILLWPRAPPGCPQVIRYAKIRGTKRRASLTALLARRAMKIAAIALANKVARMAWAMMAKGEGYKERVALAA